MTRIQRRGYVLVGAIICMLVASIVTTTVLQRSIRHRAEARRRLWQNQADWLAHSAIQKASRQLNGDKQYAGETWSPQLDYPAKVEISVAMQDGQRWITVLANYPDHPFQRAQTELRLRLDPQD